MRRPDLFQGPAIAPPDSHPYIPPPPGPDWETGAPREELTDEEVSTLVERARRRIRENLVRLPGRRWA
jgi:hypothetical protein